MPAKKEEPKKAAPKKEPAKKDAPKKEEKKAPVKYTVKFDKDKGDWIFAKTDVDRAIRRCKTKEEALKTAKIFSEHGDVPLTVHKKNGKFQKQ